MTRGRTPVVDFPLPTDGALRTVLDVLRGCLGRLVSLADLPLFAEHGGYTLVAAAAPGTTVMGSQAVVDLVDAGVDQVRVVAYGANSSGSATLQVYDTAAAQALCTVTLTSVSNAFAFGAWTKITPAAGDRQLELRVVGDGAATQTLYRVDLQLRTTHFQA